MVPDASCCLCYYCCLHAIALGRIIFTMSCILHNNDCSLIAVNSTPHRYLWLHALTFLSEMGEGELCSNAVLLQ